MMLRSLYPVASTMWKERWNAVALVGMVTQCIVGTVMMLMIGEGLPSISASMVLTCTQKMAGIYHVAYVKGVHDARSRY